MTRLLLLLLALMALGPGSAGAAAPVVAPAPAPAITTDQAKAALDVLNDPKKRAAFEATLQAILKASPAAQAAPASAQDAGLEPDSMGAQVLLRANATVTRVGEQVREALRSARSAPLLWSWIVVMTTNPLGQAILWNVGWRLLLALAIGLGAAWILRWLLRKPMARLDSAAIALAPPLPYPEDRAEAGDLEAPGDSGGRLVTLLHKLWLAAGRFGLVLLPLVGLLAAGHVVHLLVGGPQSSGLTIEAVLSATALSMALAGATIILLFPADGRLRLVRLGDAGAIYLTRWLRRLIIIAVGGYAVAEVGVLLGLSDPGHDAVLRATGVLLTLCLGIMIVTRRVDVRNILQAPELATGPMVRVREGLAAAWHWLALCGLGAIWLGWAVDGSLSGGVLLRTVGLMLLVLAASKLILMGLMSQIDRIPAIGERMSSRYPGLENRLKLYHPALSTTVRGIVYLIVALAWLQVLGTGALVWLWATQGGQRVLSGILTLAITILVAVAVWELVNAAIQRHLNRLLQDAQVARSARLRTLLPLLRTTLLIAISIVAVLMILSEVGVNIAPLLAGAGILGVAIGFGSQKLVQDLITGIFLLLENALQVGDWVNVAGVAGRVEGLSVRTIRLRAADGAVHIVPFSSVGSVTNQTRGQGNADVRATVEFAADTDEVAAIMADIVTEMRTESDFESKIVKDFQLFGVDKIDAGGVTVTGQVACTDSGRWSVQREINRRMKLRFNAAGIRFFSEPSPPAN